MRLGGGRVDDSLVTRSLDELIPEEAPGKLFE